MGELYERLLAEVSVVLRSGEDTHLLAVAVEAVLELHKPLPVLDNVVCKSPDHPAEPWPCPTVRAIARALDVEVPE